MERQTRSSQLALRPTVLGLAKILALLIGQIPFIRAAPLHASNLLRAAAEEDEGKDPGDPELWINLTFAAALVLLGGAFAGLTIALMGQDEIYLQVIRDSGEGAERAQAAKVLRLLRRGKHWVLVTLLLSNVITNETLPIVLDRSLGGGWPAVLGSTVLIVIFGEVAPQSVCVRYGLPIGAWMAPFVQVLMYLLAPVAWPTAKLLDYLLGEDHGTVYKKAGLKTLVSLHRSLGEAGQQLNADEVTIISAVLDLKEKSVGSIMTPMDDVFTLSLDDVLDEPTMDNILSQGYSRIPIHHPDNDSNFVGMLLVKMLITYDPEDAKPVRDIALATLPETRPGTSCLDIVNFFQEGKSHMVLVSEYPGEDHGALGVVTLEDVIEELIGEEIVDESDVFVDVHKAIRRAFPAPTRRISKQYSVVDPATANGAAPDLVDIGESETLSNGQLRREKTIDALPPKAKLTTGTRRRGSGTNSVGDAKTGKKQATTEDIKEHLKHLGPSNLASRPRSTRYNTVKIKPGADSAPKETGIVEERPTSYSRLSISASDYNVGVGEGVVSSAGKSASGGVQALKQGYGAMTTSPIERRPSSVAKGTQAGSPQVQSPASGGSQPIHSEQASRPPSRPQAKQTKSQNSLNSLTMSPNRSRSPFYSQGPARSGSITENFIDTNGFRKLVLETTSSSDSNEERGTGGQSDAQHPYDSSTNVSSVQLRDGTSNDNVIVAPDEVSKKKKRRRKKHWPGKGERDPLLGNR